MGIVKLCECGCGQPTLNSQWTDKRRCVRKGESQRFIKNHQRRGVNWVAPSSKPIFCVCGCGQQMVPHKNGRCGKYKQGHYAKFINNPYKFVTYEEKFWDKVNIRGIDECWEWKQYKNNGYGSVRYQGKMHPAHRIAFILSGGILTQREKFTCHHCDNPPCCNPAHLFAGNADDNNKDRARKGRSGNSKGERSPAAKITKKQVSEIRNIRKIKRTSYWRIGELYGIGSSQVSRICHYESWGHIP